MLKFLKFYFHKVIKRWWTIFIVIPILLPKVLDLDSFYFDSKYTPHIQKMASFFSPWWKWIAVLIFLLANIWVIYKLWKENGEDKSSLQDDKTPEKYTNIAKKLDRLLPSKSVQIREKFASGYKCLTELSNRDINTAICIYFGAYKEIREFLIQFLRSGSVEITVEISEIRSKFERNCSQLEVYNNNIGKNNNQVMNEHDVQKLIDDINDNLNSLFAHL